jgi:phosphotriesterase-related protein
MVAVPTARGDSIDSSEMGFTLPTEHVFFHPSLEIDFNWPDQSFGGPEMEEKRVADAVEVLRVAKEAGVDTIVDRTVPGTGRFIPRVKLVAERSPVNIIVATGWYTWNELPGSFKFRERYAKIIGKPVVTLEDLLVRDIEEGIADTGVRAGVIKFASDHYGLTDGVRSAIKAAAGAHRRTGVPITTHTGVNIGVASGVEQQRALEEDGVDLSRVTLGHIDFTPPEVPISEFEAILKKGSFISFDSIGLGYLNTPEGPGSPAKVQARIDRVVELCKRGYVGQIMLSNGLAAWSAWDDLFPDDLHKDPIFTAVIKTFLPALRERGVSEADIDCMTRVNPRRFYETRALGSY